MNPWASPSTGKPIPSPRTCLWTRENLKSYCQALALAGKGRTLLLAKEQMGCKLGTSVLGFEKDMEAFLDDGVLEKYGVGLYGTEEASAATILNSTYLEKGKTQAVLIAPLAAFREPPQVVVFTADSEQVMWLLYARELRQGRQNGPAPVGRGLGGLRRYHRPAPAPGDPQRHLSGSGVPPEVGPGRLPPHDGRPGDTLAALHQHVLDMAKPIAMLKNARGGAGT